MTEYAALMPTPRGASRMRRSRLGGTREVDRAYYPAYGCAGGLWSASGYCVTGVRPPPRSRAGGENRSTVVSLDECAIWGLHG